MGNAQGVDKRMITALATGSATFTPRAGAHPQQSLTHAISWATGVTAGTVVIEEALDSADTGTWAPIATIANNGSGTAYEDYVYQPGMAKSIRHRISVNVTGGGAPSVTTRIYGVSA